MRYFEVVRLEDGVEKELLGIVATGDKKAAAKIVQLQTGVKKVRVYPVRVIKRMILRMRP